MLFEVIETRASEECGCPEQELIIGMVNAIIHLESDGSGEAFFDTGSWYQEVTFPRCQNLNHLRSQAIEYVASLPGE